MKCYLLPKPVNERNIDPTVVKKVNQIISFKIGEIELLHIMNFLGGARSLDSFLKAYKTSVTKGFFPYRGFDHHEKIPAVTLWKPKTRTLLAFHKVDWPSRYQTETVETNPYWNWKLSLPATHMEAGTNELIQWLFAVV